MHTLNLDKAMKKVPVNNIKNFIFENHYKQIWFSNETSETLEKKTLIAASKQIIRQSTWS